jgi:hypothetical protein
MACEDGDAKVKGKLPGVGSTEGKAAGLLNSLGKSACPPSLSEHKRTTTGMRKLRDDLI